MTPDASADSSAAGDGPRGPRRGLGKGLVVAIGLVTMLLVAATTQTVWLRVPGAGAGAATDAVLSGAQAAPGLLQVALAGAAAAAFVAFADGFWRYVGGALLTAAGVAGAVMSVRVVLADGIVSPWPPVAFGLAVVGALAGACVLALSRTWGTSPARFDSPGDAEPRREQGDPAADWDRLTRGDDPTL